MEKRKLTDVLDELMNEYGSNAVLSEAGNAKRKRMNFYSSKLLRLFITQDSYATGLFQYLTLEEISKLDSAIKNHELRPIWLKTLSDNCGRDNEIYCRLKSDKAINYWCLLRHVKFTTLDFDNNERMKISYYGLYKLARYGEDITNIRLGGKSMLTPEGLAYLASGCPKLHTLEATSSLCHESLKSFGISCKDLVNVQIYGFNERLKIPIKDQDMNEFISNCKHLENFVFTSSDQPISLTSNSFKSLSNHHLTIQFIGVFDVPLEDECLFMMIKSCKLLERIGFNQVNITDNLLQIIGENCPLLNHIHLASITNLTYTNIGIQSLSSGCPLLKVVSIQGYPQMPDFDIESMVRNCPLIDRISFNHFDSVCINFSDVGKFNQLSYLNLATVTSLTDKCIVDLLPHPNHTLKELRLPAPSHFTDLVINTIANNCPLLETLVFIFPSSVTPPTYRNIPPSPFNTAALTNLLFKCNHLKRLKVGGYLSALLTAELDKRKILS